MLIYLGLVAIPLHRLFTVTNWLILLLAAGMASQGAAFLMQADLLPSITDGASPVVKNRGPNWLQSLSSRPSPVATLSR